MNKIIILFMLITAYTLKSNEITGSWNGILKVQGMQFTIVFNISESDSGLVSTMDSPDQNTFGIPVTETKYESQNLILEVKSAGITYHGILKEGIIEGTFKQSGLEFSLNLTREMQEKIIPKRPQDPKVPYPYNSEDVKFINKKDSITLAGTFTYPMNTGIFPTVVLISGSGPQNRNEELMGHKPFLVLSDYFTRNGIAVLRFDDRGFGESEGDFTSATSFDFAEDVRSAIEYLKTRSEVDKDNIGLVGHSEGGIIAPIVGSKDNGDVAFMVLLAGTGIRGDKLLLLQQELIYKSMSMADDKIQQILATNKSIFDLIINERDNAALKIKMTERIKTYIKENAEFVPEGLSEEQFLEMQINTTMSPWMLNFIRMEPSDYLKKVTCPVLAVNGEKDIQVPSKINLESIESALKSGGNSSVQTIEYPGLNHLFQKCNKCDISEYGDIEETFSTDVMFDIVKWIKEGIRKN